MKTFFKYLLVFFLSLAPYIVNAQDDEEDIDTDDKPTTDESFDKNYYWFSLRATVSVPHATANKAFRKSFVGIYQAGGDVDIMIYKGLYIGGTFENAQLKITGNKISNYSASMEVNNAAVKIGADFYMGEKNRIVLSGSIAVGQNWTTYYDLASKDPLKPPAYTQFIASYEEPAVNLYFLADENFGVGANLSYTIFNHTFDPYALRLNDWAPFDKNPTGSTQYIHFGFSFYYNILKKKKH